MNNNTLGDIVRSISKIILGKETIIELALACILARGHLLIDDLPGMGKTTLAHTLARALGLHFQRVQFTSDLLPADVLGLSIYDKEQGNFRFHPGPIFTQLFLADEINRAPPKAQSALLEAMQENQVTIDGEARPLPQPFIVIATQNPQQQLGTFPLPESQLDRFLMRLKLGYPNPEAEHALLTGQDPRSQLDSLQNQISPIDLITLQREVDTLHMDSAVVNYIQALVLASRKAEQCYPGLSPRAGLGLVRASRALAAIRQRDYVIPEDVKNIFCAVAAHRLDPQGVHQSMSGESNCFWLLDKVALP